MDYKTPYENIIIKAIRNGTENDLIGRWVCVNLVTAEVIIFKNLEEAQQHEDDHIDEFDLTYIYDKISKDRVDDLKTRLDRLYEL